MAWHHEPVPATHKERRRGYGLETTNKYLRGAAGISLGTMIKRLQRATSAATGNCLGTTIKYLRCAGGNGLGSTIKYLQRATRGAAGNGRAQRSSTCDAQRAPPRATV
jgi:hypothetical protein